MAQNELHLKVTLRIYSDDDQRCFGPGIATLLQRVREHHSLRAGAASMEMAYSKAWRIIRTAETVGRAVLMLTLLVRRMFQAFAMISCMLYFFISFTSWGVPLVLYDFIIS